MNKDINISQESKRILWTKGLTHLLVLLIIFVGPELVFSIGRTFPKSMLFTPLCYIILFYINYYLLIDRYLFNKKKMWVFIIINILLLIGVIAVFYILETSFNPKHIPLPPIMKQGVLPPPPAVQHGVMGEHIYRALSMFPRIGTMALLSIILSIVLRLSEKWMKWERLEQQIKTELQENELKNLKNQLNPHFLFNALNNIYALISISQDKAQKSIHELSQLLRYTLYDNNEREVPLEKDLQFVKNYISLMRLRLSSHVSLTVNINEKEGTGKTIAPLLFISLVENAFKHGVSGDKPCFIDISIKLKDDCVICHVENSCFPKKENDKSGSGIGINNLKKQLGILYAGRYTFNTIRKDERFIAELSISLTSSKQTTL